MKTFKEFSTEHNSITESGGMVTISVEWKPEAKLKSEIVKTVKQAHGVTIKSKSNDMVDIAGEASDVIKVLSRSAYSFGYTTQEIEKMFPELKS